MRALSSEEPNFGSSQQHKSHYTQPIRRSGRMRHSRRCEDVEENRWCSRFADATAPRRAIVDEMKESKHSKPQAAADPKRLEAIRGPLLTLHKTLVDSERIEYEKTIGKIRSPGHFLQLLTSDPWFAWLSPLSQLIVSIDEALDGKEPLRAAKVEALLQQSARLLMPSETGSGFSNHYFEAMQRDPDVVLAHGAVARLRSSPKPEDGAAPKRD